MRKNLIFSVLVAVITVLAFAAAFSFGITQCDDYYYVAYRPEVMGGLSLSGFRFAFQDIAQSIWMPLAYMSYMLDYSLGWGYGGMHIQSILWHAAGAIVLFFILDRLFASKVPAFLAALIWAVHPLRVESVVWIASRKDVISTFFLLAALLSWLRAKRGDLCWLCASFVLVVVGAMAKPSIMIFPVFALALDFLVTKERKSSRVYCVFAALSIAIAMEASMFQRAGGASSLSDMIPLWYRVLNALASITIYIGNTFWPDALAMQCMIRYPDLPRFSVLGIVVLLPLLGWLGYVAVVRGKAYLADRDYEHLFNGDETDNAVLAGIGIFFVCLGPFLGIAGFGIHAFADRFTILPAIGLSLALAALLKKFPLRGCSAALIAVVIAALALQTRHQTGYWGDEEKLMLHTLEIDRDKNPDTHRGLGVHYWEVEHDMEKVYAHLKKAHDYCWDDQVREMMSQSTHLLIEACYATGREQEAEDYYYWFRKVDFKRNGETGSIELLMADALWTLHSKASDRIEKAQKILEKIEENNPDIYIASNLAYLIAKESQDSDKIHEALVRCAKTKDCGSGCTCQWATRLLNTLAK